MKEQNRYSLHPSSEYIYQWLIFMLIINLGIFAIVYFLITPIINNSANPDFYAKLAWGIFTGVMFVLFALTFIIANGPRYWVDFEEIEIWWIYRPKKRKQIPLFEIVEIKIRRTPVISNAFNIGTLVLFKESSDGKPKVAVRLIGIKFPTEVYLDLLSKCKFKDKRKEFETKELLV
ncbi:MAG: hypothetical protein ACTSSH_14280 [Candidatus Heimdallarchaeota archaeon]